jgi:hypothetical protein
MPALLEKRRYVLVKTFVGTNMVGFDSADHEFGTSHYDGVDMPVDVWRQLGAPQTITVTIEPGDQLNSEEEQS